MQPLMMMHQHIIIALLACWFFVVQHLPARPPGSLTMRMISDEGSRDRSSIMMKLISSLQKCSFVLIKNAPAKKESF
jgi:hypothetical protein